MYIFWFRNLMISSINCFIPLFIMKRILVFTGAMALLYFTACSAKKEDKEEHSQFTVTSPIEIDTAYTKEYVAQIRSVRNIELRAQEKGYLQQIFVDEGQTVKAGQLLFKIMPKIYEAELAKAQAEAKAAQIEFQNAKSLADKDVVSKNEQLMAEAKLDQAKAEVTLAKLHLSFTEIRAPFDGTIDRIPLKLGSLVDEGELLTSLSDNSQIFAYYNVSEPEYLDYQSNIQGRGDQEVSLLLANNKPLKDKGKIEVIEGEFNSETGNIAFRARFANAERLLRNGQTGKVQMRMPMPHAILIPQKATYEIQDKKYVFVVDKDNKVHSRNITVASEMPDLYVVASGLSPQDKILLEGVQKVKEDELIHFSFLKPREVISNLRLKAE